MKNLFLVMILLCATISKAQNVNKISIDDLVVIAHEESTLMFLKKDSTFLEKGNYEITTQKSTITFQINNVGHIDGNFIAYHQNGNMGRKMNMQNGRIVMEINFNEEGKITDSTVFGTQIINLFDSTSKKFLPKQCWVKHKFEISVNRKKIFYETIYFRKQRIFCKTFHSNNTVKSIEYEGNYMNEYDESGNLINLTTYNWKTKEITKFSYENKKLILKVVSLDENFIWNNGSVEKYIVQILPSNLNGNNSDKVSTKNYSTTTTYYPNEKIKRIEITKNGLVVTKEYSPSGKLLNQNTQKEAPINYPSINY